MRFSSLWSQSFLQQKWVLWVLFISNLLGTIYGYYWYKDQLILTWDNFPHWFIVFVPDSPTASLYFTLALLFLMFPPKRKSAWIKAVRVVIEALAVVTSIKYGIWACAMIIAGTALGEPLVWQDWMLMASHSAMAIEAVLYVRLFRYGAISTCIAALYTWFNDALDYTADIFPWLPRPLYEHLSTVSWFTFCLTGLSVLTAWIGYKYRDVNRPSHIQTTQF